MDKKTQVMKYFDAIGRRYDLADTLMSFGLHFIWRRTCMRRLIIKHGYRILDLCGGAGEFARRIARAGPQGLPVVCDLSMTMLTAGKGRGPHHSTKKKIQWVRGDAEYLCFANNSFDAVIVGYGIRNLADLESGLREMRRVLIPGGKLVIMEFSIPRTPWIRTLYKWYSFKIMPSFGKLITGEDAPFIYLSESVRSFPDPRTVRTILQSAGFNRVSFERFSDGLVTVYSGMKPNARLIDAEHRPGKRKTLTAGSSSNRISPSMYSNS
ncbi:MAG: ubiquinone/menaquinone biosynthesis methyltransferase [Desulfosalsimonas sp.]